MYGSLSGAGVMSDPGQRSGTLLLLRPLHCGPLTTDPGCSGCGSARSTSLLSQAPPLTGTWPMMNVSRFGVPDGASPRSVSEA